MSIFLTLLWIYPAGFIALNDKFRKDMAKKE